MSSHQSSDSQVRHHHGFWLTAFLVIVVLHALFNIWLVRDSIQQQYEPLTPWIVPAFFLVAVVDIIAVIGIWYWKKWGLYLFAVSTLITIMASLALTGSIFLLFFYLIPLGILGTIIGTRWKWFT